MLFFNYTWRIIINPNLSQLGTENAFLILAKAEKLKQQGKDIINLGIGQPDFRTPEHIVEASIKALKDGKHGYTPANGILELREAVAKDILLRRKVEINPDNIVIVPGGKVTMWHTILMFGTPGKEIIYPNPGFPIYESVINFTGAKAVPMKLSMENQFNIDVENLKSLINKNTSLIIFNSPSNPTGGLISKKDMQEIILLLEKNPHVHILSDEIYSRITYTKEDFQSMLSFPQIKDRIILLDGWSKTYAMTGWRVGYSVWPNSLVNISEKLNINSFSCTNAPAQYGALAALEGPQECVDIMTSTFDRRRKMIFEEINKLNGFKCNMSKGAFYSMPSIQGTGLKSDKIEDILLNKLGITTVSGKSFGVFGEGYLRLSYASSDENIKEAINRIKEFIATVGWHNA